MKARRRNVSLDLLRGVAILLVLDFHFAPNTHDLLAASVLYYPFRWVHIEYFGWAGVDIFFVLSGFLVGGLLIKEWKQQGTVNVRGFLLRRAMKIWPQYYFFLAVMLLLHPHRAASMVGNFLNIQNYTGTPFFHTWSLAVEEHFYLLLVFAIAWAAARTVRPWMMFRILTGVAVSVSILRFSLILWNGASNMLYTHVRIDGLLWGVLLAIRYHWNPNRFAAMQRLWWLWLIVLCGCIVDLCMPNDPLRRALGINCADFAGVALLLLVYRPDDHRHSWPCRLIAWIGFYSYGIYLWHESVVEPVELLTARVAYHPLQIAIQALAPWLLAFALGIVTTKLIEIPALLLRDRLLPGPVGSPIEPAPRTAG